jgi:hypothetical protein
MERMNADVFLAGLEKAFRYIYTSFNAASEGLLEASDHKNIQKQLEVDQQSFGGLHNDIIKKRT